jgi:hypothetical protein
MVYSSVGCIYTTAYRSVAEALFHRQLFFKNLNWPTWLGISSFITSEAFSQMSLWFVKTSECTCMGTFLVSYMVTACRLGCFDFEGYKGWRSCTIQCKEMMKSVFWRQQCNGKSFKHWHCSMWSFTLSLVAKLNNLK